MRLTLRIALRYFLARRRRRAVHFITGIAITGITLGTAALILVLSVFNGFQDLLEQMYGAIDADIRIEMREGKGIVDEGELRKTLQAFPEVDLVAGTLEGKAALRYQGNQRIVRIKGVEQDFFKLNQFRSALSEGDGALIWSDSIVTGIPGLGIANYMGLRTDDFFNPPELVVVPDKIKPGTSPENALRQMPFLPSAFFSFQKEYDDNWVILPIEMTRYLMDYENVLTAYELRLKKGVSSDQFKAQLQASLGEEYKVLSKFEVHEDIYRVMKNEKFAGYLILTLMLIIAGANIVGGLAVIVIEKQKDISVLKALGATSKQIRNIFLLNGMLVGLTGIIVGGGLAFILGYTQMEYGWMAIEGGETFAVEAYPLRLKVLDFVTVSVTVMVLSLLAAVGPAIKAAGYTVVEGLRR